MNNMEHMNAARFTHLMRANGWTIRDLARSAGVSQDRVRELRTVGIAVGTGARRWAGRIRSAREASQDVAGWTQILRREVAVAA